MRSYRERLHVPVVWWLLAVVVAVLVGGELYAGFGAFGELAGLIAFAAFTVSCLAFLLSWSAARIEVTGDRLVAARATLPLTHVIEVVPLEEKQFAQLRGPRGNPAAHLLLRPYLKRGVYLAVHDPAGRVPYWLISTRHPAELAAAIAAGGGAAGADAPHQHDRRSPAIPTGEAAGS